MCHLARRWLRLGLVHVVAGRKISLFARKLNSENGPFPFAGTFGRHNAAMHFDQMSHDRESKTQAAVRTRRRTLLLGETSEQPRKKLGLDPFSSVAYLNLDGLVRRFPHAFQSNRALAS